MRPFSSASLSFGVFVSHGQVTAGIEFVNSWWSYVEGKQASRKHQGCDHAQPFISSIGPKLFFLSSGVIRQSGAAFVMVRTTYPHLSVFTIWRCCYFVVCFNLLTWSESLFLDTRGPAMKDEVSRLLSHKWCWCLLELRSLFCLTLVLRACFTLTSGSNRLQRLHLRPATGVQRRRIPMMSRTPRFWFCIRNPNRDKCIQEKTCPLGLRGWRMLFVSKQAGGGVRIMCTIQHTMSNKRIHVNVWR